MVRRKPRMNTVLGALFCLVGGALAALSTLLGSWVDPIFIDPNSHYSMLTTFDLFAKGGVYYLTMLVPFGALLAVLMAIAVLVREMRTRDISGTFATGTLAFSLMSAVALLLTVMQLNTDYILTSTNLKYGPAVFLAVFGIVIATAGGMVLMVDYLERRKRAGRFATSGGSKDLAALLWPTSKSSRSLGNDETREKGQQDEALASNESRRAREVCVEDGSCCPNCHSPVQPDWRICPICGEELD